MAVPSEKKKRTRLWRCGVGGGVLAAWQDRVRNVPLDLLHLCGGLQVLGEGGEALAATSQSRRLLGP